MLATQLVLSFALITSITGGVAASVIPPLSQRRALNIRDLEGRGVTVPLHPVRMNRRRKSKSYISETKEHRKRTHFSGALAKMKSEYTASNQDATNGEVTSPKALGNVHMAAVIPGDQSTPLEPVGTGWPKGIKKIVHPKPNSYTGYSAISLSRIQPDGSTDKTLAPATEPISVQSEPMLIEQADLGYIVRMKVGSEGEEFNLVVDTGSSDTWLGSTSCSSCQRLNTFGPTESTSFTGYIHSPCAFLFSLLMRLLTTEMLNENHTITYGAGDLKYQAATDTFSLAGFTIDAYKFGVASEISDELADNAFDGILGTGKQGISSMNARTFPEMLMDTGALPNAVVSYALGRTADGENTGALTIGGYDASRMNPESEQILPVASTEGSWSAQMGAVMIDNKLVLEQRTVILDTGTTLIYMSPEDATAIHGLIPGSQSRTDGLFTVPCDMKQIVYLQFGEVAYSIDPRDITFQPIGDQCFSSITAEPDRTEWIIGDTFLKNVYMITDEGNNNIHLAGREGSNMTFISA